MTNDSPTRLSTVDCHFITMADFIDRSAAWLKQGQTRHVVTLNPEMVVRAENDADFRQAVRRSDLCVPDGAGLFWARWYLRTAAWPLWPSLAAFIGQRVERITGVDAVLRLAKLCNDNQRGIFLLGAQERSNQLTAQLLRHKFPELDINRAPAHSFNMDGPPSILAKIRKCRPGVLLVAYGAPAQSLWIEHNRSRLPDGTIAIGVGGAFDIFSERLKRAPEWLKNINGEWLWRLWQEPRRLRRIYTATVRFPLLIHKYKRGISQH